MYRTTWSGPARLWNRYVVAIAIATVVTVTAPVTTFVNWSATARAASCVGGADNTSAPNTFISDWPTWKPIFSDNFDRCTLGPQYGIYSGQPGGNPNSQWSPSMVTMSDGMLHLNASQVSGKWVTGGVSLHTVSQLYGKWEVRFRIQKSDEVSFHLLLWPQNGSWPPEIDFLESTDGTRQTASAAVHYIDYNGSQGRVMQGVTGDFTKWTVAGVEWGPGTVRATLNGKVWATVTDPRVPATPMWLAMQTEAGACQRNSQWGLPPCPRAGTPSTMSMDIDWVSVYKPGWML